VEESRTLTLYHFCADKHVKNILKQGLCRGGVIELGPRGMVSLHTGWIWLTTNGDAKAQDWEGRVLIPYSRTAWRLTVEIPEKETDRLYDRERLLKIYPGAATLFETPGSESYRVYRGSIPKAYIKEARKTQR